MGSIIKPICSCGALFKELFLGGGKMNFMRVCNVPGVCMHCGTIIETNILDKYHRCKKCKNEMILIGKIISFEYLDRYNPATHYVFTWGIISMLDRTYVLEDKLYTCPKCKEEKLKFEFQGCWD
jgi:predicted Zn-ribbon and HTH transcriptional regulator